MLYNSLCKKLCVNVFLYRILFRGDEVKMKIYKKPEIEIVEFTVADMTNATYEFTSNDDFPMLNPNSDEVFYGIEAGEEGYLVN